MEDARSFFEASHGSRTPKTVFGFLLMCFLDFVIISETHWEIHIRSLRKTAKD